MFIKTGALLEGLTDLKKVENVVNLIQEAWGIWEKLAARFFKYKIISFYLFSSGAPRRKLCQYFFPIQFSLINI